MQCKAQAVSHTIHRRKWSQAQPLHTTQWCLSAAFDPRDLVSLLLRMRPCSRASPACITGKALACTVHPVLAGYTMHTGRAGQQLPASYLYAHASHQELSVHTWYVYVQPAHLQGPRQSMSWKGTTPIGILQLSHRPTAIGPCLPMRSPWRTYKHSTDAGSKKQRITWEYPSAPSSACAGTICRLGALIIEMDFETA